MGLKNILIISEEKSDHLVLCSSLARAIPQRFNVTLATSLERPIDALMDKSNDAVILAQAPETDYLLRLAQKNSVSIPIIVLLGEASAATVSRVKNLGARDYLLRGNIQDELLHRILDYSIELACARTEILSLSNRDALTGVLNRTGFRAHVERAIARSERYQCNTALLYINIDRFTNINDQYGEGAGDQAIKMIARRLSSRKRNTDSVARLGGDEFAIVLEDINTDSDVDRVAEKVIASITEPMRLNEQQVAIEVSIGAAVCPENGGCFEDLVEAARSAMTQAKAVPGNKYLHYTDQLSFNSGGSTTLAADLRQAVRHDQFELYYQPRIDLKSEQVVGLEALIRWIHPERGIVRPEEFLPLCENMGLMKIIGHRVIEKACAAINWLNERQLEHIDIAVNVSFSQFQDQRFGEVVKEIVEASGIEPKRLEFELTENLEEVQFLKNSNCDQVQGFYYSPAIPLQQIPRFVEEQMFSQSSLGQT